MADFSQLPEDILSKIASHHMAASFADHVAFTHVCKSWRSAALLPHNLRRRGRPGILMSRKVVPRRDNDVSTVPPRCGPPHKYYPDLKLTPSDPGWEEEESAAAAASFDNIGKASHCLASNDGWLVLVRPGRGGGRFVTLYLLNPVTGETVAVPQLKRRRFGLKGIRKAVLSSNPDHDGIGDDGCYLFLFFNSAPQMAWCKVVRGGGGGGGWKVAGGQGDDERIFKDVPDAASYSGGKLYVVASDCVYVVDNLARGTVRAMIIPFSPAMKSPWYETRTSPYVCHIDGQLHVILLRRLRRVSDETTFHVYKLLPQTTTKATRSTDHDNNWEKATSLKGHAVFLGGTHQCFSVPPPAPASAGGDVIGSSMITKDCIYFALNGCLDLDAASGGDNGDWDWSRYDCGVFSVGDEVNQWKGYTNGRYNSFWFFPMPWNMSKHREHDREMTELKA